MIKVTVRIFMLIFPVFACVIDCIDLPLRLLTPFDSYINMHTHINIDGK